MTVSVPFDLQRTVAPGGICLPSPLNPYGSWGCWGAWGCLGFKCAYSGISSGTCVGLIPNGNLLPPNNTSTSCP